LSGTLIVSNVSRIGLNFVIAVPVCSAIHKFPSLSKAKASGDARAFSGVNSEILLFFGLITPILPVPDSVN